MAALAAAVCAITTLFFPDTALAAAKKTAVAAATPEVAESFFKKAVGFVLHLDKHLIFMFSEYGALAYGRAGALH